MFYNASEGPSVVPFQSILVRLCHCEAISPFVWILWLSTWPAFGGTWIVLLPSSHSLPLHPWRWLFSGKTPVNRSSFFSEIWNTSRICVSSLRRGHANLLCIVPILVYVLPKQAPGPVLNWPWGNRSGAVWGRGREENHWRTKNNFFFILTFFILVVNAVETKKKKERKRGR